MGGRPALLTSPLFYLPLLTLLADIWAATHPLRRG